MRVKQQLFRQGCRPVNPSQDQGVLDHMVGQFLSQRDLLPVQREPGLVDSKKNPFLVMIHMFGGFQVGLMLANKAWLVGNIGLPEADVASTQQKELAALGYSASPCRELWLWKGED
ncbi:hypothetical protein DSO57_1018774 [Entomophthora muscae]|uniref:Uncharacterized protein n=1 Tax=Entomophthora muscae TaxID=34485 RepID=A0ACC2SH39_9FUNG|nr:hypothetical protein DSO57_1018774 [Entomophthora muscae]